MNSSDQQMAKKPLFMIGLLGVSILALIVYVGIKNPIPPTSSVVGDASFEQETKVAAFKSESDFKEYLSVSNSQISNTRAFMGSTTTTMDAVKTSAPEMALGGDSGTVDRVSTTNVQVAGIDEPDIVKTDGENIYVSSENYYRGMMPVEPVLMESVIDSETSIRAPEYIPPTTSILKAFPLSELGTQSTLDANGELLLAEYQLIVKSYSSIKSFDVSDSNNPKQTWDLSLADNTTIMTSRLTGDTLYLVTQTYINTATPCPIPLSIDSQSKIMIPCNKVFHPLTPISSDVTYTVLALNPQTGDVKKTTTFVGSSSYSTVSMFSDALFVTYGYQESQFDFLTSFFSTNAADLVPARFLEKISKLSSYDISENSKNNELYAALEEYFQSLDPEKASDVQKSLEKRAEDYFKDHARDIERTGIIKISVPDLETVATGGIPGSILNQFSLDQYEGNLRIATTSHGNWTFVGSGESINDVYILDGTLQQIGAILDLGITEQIYAARFVGDRGYLVTFRQVDPFYVLDLSDARNPKLAGELKIPGYSSYLHPISDQYIVGIGQITPTIENNISDPGSFEGAESIMPIERQFLGPQVKVSLFDVSAPNSPTEVSQFLLDESWSEVSNSHHAFLLDPKHKILFIPTGSGGYVLGYQDGELDLKVKVDVTSARRAVYINDYLYIVGDSSLTVLDETTWQTVATLDFN